MTTLSYDEDLFSDTAISGGPPDEDDENKMDDATEEAEGKTLCTMLIPHWLHPGQVQYQAMHVPPPHAHSA